MQLAYLINTYPKTSHTFVRREIEALEQLGHVVERFAIRESEEGLVDPDDQREASKTRILLAGGITELIERTLRALLTRPRRFVSALGLTIRLGWRSDRGVLRHLGYLAEACVLLGLLETSRAEHLHAHFGTNSAAVAMLCAVLGGPGYSFTVHGPEEFDKPLAIGLPEKIRRARFVAAVSSYGRSQLCRWSSHHQWHKLHVVHCGVDNVFLQRSQAATQAKQTASPIPDVARFVCVGRLCEQKGQLLLLEAAGLLARQGVQFELVLVGDGELRHELEESARSSGIADRVLLTGWRTGDGVRSEIEAARVMVLPSFAEGLPVVIMEALALGRPVISTYVAGIPELVVPGECGWLIPAGTVEPLAEAMREALQTPVERLTAMGTAGAGRVADQHDAAKEAKKLSQFFQTSHSGPSIHA